MSKQKVFTLAQVRDVLPDGTPVPEVRATIVKVHKFREGIAQKGKMKGKPWYLQTIVLKDQEGTELECKINDKEEGISRDWEGRTVILSAYDSDERGLVGLYAWTDPYDDQQKLKMTKAGDIALLEGGRQTPREPQRQLPAPRPKGEDERMEEEYANQERAQRQPRTQRTQRQPDPEPEPQPEPEQPKQEDAVTAAVRHMHDAFREAYQVANLQLMALTITETYTSKRFKEKTGRDLTPEEKHAWSMNMAIDLVKAGVHRKLPHYDMAKLEKAMEAQMRKTDTTKPNENEQ